MRGDRKSERLRQERESFDVQKKQSERWFAVRMATALILLLMAVGVFVIAAMILLSPAGYSPAIVQSSAVAMMLDLAAIAGTAIIALIKANTQQTLGPVMSRLSDD